MIEIDESTVKIAEAHDAHTGRRQRVRDRFFREGLTSFEEHEVLELLLYYSIPMRDTNVLAHRLLKEYGSLANLMETNPKELVSRCKISENTATLISLIPPLSRCYLMSRHSEKTVLDSSTKAGDYVKNLFVGYSYEVFQIVVLNSKNQVNHSCVIHEGTINEAAVYPRLIVETALRHKAVSIIIAHNHPGGSMMPSSADISVTKKIRTALEAISIRLMDHIIVAGNTYTSFAEKDLL